MEVGVAVELIFLPFSFYFLPQLHPLPSATIQYNQKMNEMNLFPIRRNHSRFFV